MLVPVPGLSHIKVWNPDPHLSNHHPYAAHRDLSTAAMRTPSSLVKMALEVAFGTRALSNLPHARFSRSVRIYLAARLRSHPLRGEVTIISLHGREGGEIFGTARAGARYVAFIAVYDGHTLATFRIL